jgi:hypothetical protein
MTIQRGNSNIVEYTIALTVATTGVMGAPSEMNRTTIDQGSFEGRGSCATRTTGTFYDRW